MFLVLAGSIILLLSSINFNLSFIPSNPSNPALFKSFRLTGFLRLIVLLVTVTNSSSSSYSYPDAFATSLKITGTNLVPNPTS